MSPHRPSSTHRLGKDEGRDRRIQRALASRQFFLCSIVLLPALTSACDTPIPPTSPGYAVRRSDSPVSVSGHALDYGTNVGVSDVTVALGALDFSGRFVAQAATVTGATGSYTLAIRPGTYLAQVGDRFGSIHVMDAVSRGDFLVNSGSCVSRYGMIADMLTGRAVAGARVLLAGRTVSSDADGWYRVDLGCPANGLFGFNTTLMYVSHPTYSDWTQSIGRGVFGVARLDVGLGRRTRP
jgi:hypothetical protein